MTAIFFSLRASYFRDSDFLRNHPFDIALRKEVPKAQFIAVAVNSTHVGMKLYRHEGYSWNDYQKDFRKAMNEGFGNGIIRKIEMYETK